MIGVNKNISKACSFYASDWHFITMLLPHIDKSINQKNKITTILEKDTQEQMKNILEKLNLKNKENILNIDWHGKEVSKENVERILRKRGEQKLEIIISGTEKYIKEANNIIDEYIEKNNIKREIKIINCYYIEDNINIKEVLNNHDKVLNTAGEKDVEKFVMKVGE